MSFFKKIMKQFKIQKGADDNIWAYIAIYKILTFSIFVSDHIFKEKTKTRRGPLRILAHSVSGGQRWLLFRMCSLSFAWTFSWYFFRNTMQSWLSCLKSYLYVITPYTSSDSMLFFFINLTLCFGQFSELIYMAPAYSFSLLCSILL